MPTVLVADDDQNIREVLTMALEDEGYTVQSVIDGVALLDRLRAASERFVVLLDRYMPRMGGIEVLAVVTREPVLRDRHAYALLTAASSSLSAEDWAVVTSSGAVVLAKPFDLERLFGAVATLAERVRPSAS